MHEDLDAMSIGDLVGNMHAQTNAASAAVE